MSVWGSAAIAGVTAASTLAGVWLTGRQSRLQAEQASADRRFEFEEARAESRRRELLDLTADYLESAQEATHAFIVRGSNPPENIATIMRIATVQGTRIAAVAPESVVRAHIELHDALVTWGILRQVENNEGSAAVQNARSKFMREVRLATGQAAVSEPLGRAEAPVRPEGPS